MDAGAGKTLPAYNLVKSIKDIDFVLYIAPFKLIHNEITYENVVTEITKYGGFDCDHEFIGIESIQQSDRVYLECLKKLELHNNSIIILDESIKIKNSESKRANRLFEFAKYSNYRLILNGTPISRNLLDIWSQMHFLSPKILSMSHSEFKNTFVSYTIMHKGSVKREWINGYTNLDYLYKLIEPFIFEASFDAGINVQYIESKYAISENNKEEYQRLKDFYLSNEELEARNNNIFIEITQKMQHCYSICEEKEEIIYKIIKENPNDKILVVAKFIDSQDFLKEKFKDKITVLSYGKHAYGLNLQDYSIMVIWDKTFDYGAYYQILRRIIRRGQTKDCRVFEMIANTPLDDLMKKNIETKGNLLKQFKQKSIKEKVKKL